MKLLHWERGGFVIYYKRMESGRISHKIFIPNYITMKCNLIALLKNERPYKDYFVRKHPNLAVLSIESY